MEFENGYFFGIHPSHNGYMEYNYSIFVKFQRIWY